MLPRLKFGNTGKYAVTTEVCNMGKYAVTVTTYYIAKQANLLLQLTTDRFAIRATHAAKTKLSQYVQICCHN